MLPTADGTPPPRLRPGLGGASDDSGGSIVVAAHRRSSGAGASLLSDPAGTSALSLSPAAATLSSTAMSAAAAGTSGLTMSPATAGLSTAAATAPAPAPACTPACAVNTSTPGAAEWSAFVVTTPLAAASPTMSSPTHRTAAPAASTPSAGAHRAHRAAASPPTSQLPAGGAGGGGSSPSNSSHSSGEHDGTRLAAPSSATRPVRSPSYHPPAAGGWVAGESLTLDGGASLPSVPRTGAAAACAAYLVAGVGTLGGSMVVAAAAAAAAAAATGPLVPKSQPMPVAGRLVRVRASVPSLLPTAFECSHDSDTSSLPSPIITLPHRMPPAAGARVDLRTCSIDSGGGEGGGSPATAAAAAAARGIVSPSPPAQPATAWNSPRDTTAVLDITIPVRVPQPVHAPTEWRGMPDIPITAGTAASTPNSTSRTAGSRAGSRGGLGGRGGGPFGSTHYVVGGGGAGCSSGLLATTQREASAGLSDTLGLDQLAAMEPEERHRYRLAGMAWTTSSSVDSDDDASGSTSNTGTASAPGGTRSRLSASRHDLEGDGGGGGGDGSVLFTRYASASGTILVAVPRVDTLPRGAPLPARSPSRMLLAGDGGNGNDSEDVTSLGLGRSGMAWEITGGSGCPPAATSPDADSPLPGTCASATTGADDAPAAVGAGAREWTAPASPILSLFAALAPPAGT